MKQLNFVDEVQDNGRTLLTNDNQLCEVIGHGEEEGKRYLNVKFPNNRNENYAKGRCWEDGSWKRIGKPFFKLAAKDPNYESVKEYQESALYTGVYLRDDGTTFLGTPYATVEGVRRSSTKAKSKLLMIRASDDIQILNPEDVF